MNRELHSYFVDIDRQAENMFLRFVKEYTDRQEVTKQLEAENQRERIQQMNNIQACIREAVGNKIIYTQVFGYGAPAFAGVLLTVGMKRKIEFFNVWVYNTKVKNFNLRRI